MQTLVVLDPLLGLINHFGHFALLQQDVEAELMHFDEQRLERHVHLGRRGRLVGQHFFVNVLGREQVAQFLADPAVPHMGVQAERKVRFGW